jgi:O-antigen/teichoic acid export membrane protein
LIKLSKNAIRAIANTSWLLWEKLLRIGLELAIGVWVARYLGVEQFGLYVYTISFVDLFAPLISLGLPPIVVRDLIKERDRTHEILGTAFGLKLIGSLLAFILAGIIIVILRPSDRLAQILVLIIALSKIFSIFETIDFWYQSQLQSRYVVISKTFSYSISSLIRICLLQLKAQLIWFNIAFALETIITSSGLVANYLFNGFKITSWRFNLHRGITLIKESWPALLSSVAIVIQARIDQVMLGQAIGDAEVAQYAVALRIVEVFAFIPTIICQSAAPIIAEAKLISQDLFLDRMLNLYRIMFIIFVLIGAPLYIFSRPIILLLYGSQYELASQLLPLFVIRLFFANFGIAKSLFITNESLFTYAFASSVCGTLINVGMNYLLIPKNGSFGALWAGILSFWFMIFISDLFYPKLRPNLAIVLQSILTPWKVSFGYSNTK